MKTIMSKQPLLPKTGVKAVRSNKTVKAKAYSRSKTGIHTATISSRPGLVPAPVRQNVAIVSKSKLTQRIIANGGVQLATKATPVATKPSATRSIWYLGGNQIVKLLTSVDGDLDHQVLAKIAAVPSVVGDLALSVESLVSDDATVGGFETDLLAKIASNTLAAKRASITTVPPNAPAPATTPLAPSALPAPAPMTQSQPMPTQPVVATTGAVPDPLAGFKPVPNPLFRITPPVSPLGSHLTNSNTTTTVTATQAQSSSVPTPLIQAR